MAIQIGTGSWADAEYVNLLYPRGTASPKRLEWYAKHFAHVEVNGSYYRTPWPEHTTEWVQQTPKGFLFEVKPHRTFSMSPEKSALGKQMEYLLNGMGPLLKAKKLGSLLLVADPRFGPDKYKLEAFDALVERMPKVPLAVELRHVDWVKGKQRAKTLDFFRERKITWVTVDMPNLTDDSILPTIAEVTNPKLAYVRLHGRNPKYLEAKSAEEPRLRIYREGVGRNRPAHPQAGSQGRACVRGRQQSRAGLRPEDGALAEAAAETGNLRAAGAGQKEITAAALTFSSRDGAAHDADARWGWLRVCATGPNLPWRDEA